MPGIRIRPTEDRRAPDNAMIVLSDLSRPVPKPKNGKRLEDIKPKCGTCLIQHFHKTYHFQLQAGTVIVSETIWSKLLTMADNGGFEFVNVVENPPTQRLTIGLGKMTINENVLFSSTGNQNRFSKALHLKSKSARAGEMR